SDPHVQLPRWRERSLRELGPLRALATVELWKGRGRDYDDAFDKLGLIVRDADTLKADLVACTGDLTQLAMEEEFALAQRALKPLSSAATSTRESARETSSAPAPPPSAARKAIGCSTSTRAASSKPPSAGSAALPSSDAGSLQLGGRRGDCQERGIAAQFVPLLPGPKRQGLGHRHHPARIELPV